MPLGLREIMLVLRAKDQASRVIAGVGTSIGALETGSKLTAQQMLGMGTALVGAGAVIGGLGAIGLKFFNDATNSAMDYNKQVRLTQTQVDSTSVSFKDLQKLGLDIGNQFPVKFESIQKSLYDIFSSIDVSLPQARTLITAFAKAAVAGNVDIQDAGRTTIAILNAFHLPISSVNHVLDLQFQLVRKGVGTYTEFNSAIGRAIPSTIRAGQSFDTLGAMMAFLTRNGLSVTMAAASTGRALDAMANPTVAKRLQAMGISVRDARGQFRPMIDILRDMNDRFGKLTGPDRAKALQDLFKGAGGTIQARRFFDPVFKNFDEFQKRFTEMQHAPGQFSAAYNRMADAEANKMQLLNNRYQIMKVTVGEQLIPVKLKLMEILGKLLSMWNNLSPGVQNVIIKFLAITAAVMLFVGVVLVVVGAIVAFIGALTIVAGSVSAAIAVILIGIAVIAAIVAILVIAVLWHKQIAAAAKAAWRVVKEAVTTAWNYIYPILIAIGNFFTGTLPDAFNAFVSAVVSAWNTFTSAAQTAWDTVVNALTTAWNAIYSNVLQPFATWFSQNVTPVLSAFGELVSAVLMRVREAFNAWWAVVSLVLNLARQAIQLWWQFYVQVMDQVIIAMRAFWSVASVIFSTGLEILRVVWTTVWGAIVAVAKVVLAIIRGDISIFVGVVLALWRPFLNSLLAVAQLVWNLIKTAIEAALRIIRGIIEVVTGLIKGDWSQVWHGILTIVGGVWDGIRTTISVGISFMKTIISSGLDAVIGLFRELPSRAYRAAIGVIGSLEDLGRAMIRGIVRGVTSIAGEVAGAVKRVVTDAINAGKKLLHLGSPSKLTFQWGVWIGQGLANGMIRSGPLVENAWTKLSKLNAAPPGIVGYRGGAAGGASFANRTLTIQPGAITTIVQGNLDNVTLQELEAHNNRMIEELTKQLS